MTDRYTRTFADFENQPWPGKILPEYFEQIANAGDGNMGLQAMIQGAMSAYGPYHVIEGCEYQSPGVPTEWTGSVGYVMYSGLIKSVPAASGALSADGSYLIYNSDTKFAVTGGNPTGVILAHNIGGTVYTVNTRYDSGSSFYLPQDLSVYGNTLIKNNLTASGTINLTGTITYTGDFTQSGYTYQTGNIYHSGHTDHIGDVSGIYPYTISGYETIIADTGQFKHITGFSNVMVDSHLDFHDAYNISGVVQLSGSLVRVDTANGLTIGNHTLTEGEWRQLTGIDGATISPTQWDYLGALDQPLVQAASPTYVGLTLSSDLVTTSTIDGAYINTLSGNHSTHLTAVNPHSNSEPSFGKNDAFNKNWGSSAGTAAQGNDGRFHSNVNDHGESHDHAHNDLGGLNDGISYEHITQVQKTALHTIYSLQQHGNASHSDINQILNTNSNVNFSSVTAGVMSLLSAGAKLKSTSTMIFESVASMTFKPDNSSSYIWRMSQVDNDDADFFQTSSTKANPQGNVGREGSNAKPLLKCLAKYLEDDGTGTSEYSHVDDLQLLREIKGWDVRKKSTIPDYPDYKQSVFDIKTLPWIKAVPQLDSFDGDSDELRYQVPLGSKIGYLLSTLQSLLERQDGLVNGIEARDLIIEDLQTRLGVLEGA